MYVANDRTLVNEIRPMTQDNEVLPAGLYPAHLKAIDSFQNAYSPRYRFVFCIDDDMNHGQTITLTTATNLNSKSKLGQTIKALLGRELSDRELINSFNPACLIGTVCKILTTHETNKAGKVYSTIDRILR